MTLRTLELVPEQPRYGAAPAASVRRVEVAGGRARHRLEHLGAPAAVDCQWIADATEYDYLLAFYRTNRAEGAVPFLIDLWLDGFPLSPYQARFLTEPRLTGHSGEAFVVAAKLEAAPYARDAGDDQDLIDSYAPMVDGLQVMGLTPSSAGYTAQRGDELLIAKPGAGAAGIRAGLEREAASIRVGWVTDARGYAYLLAFYFTGIRECALPFRIDLVLDRSEATEYVAVMVPGSFSLDNVSGNKFSVSADIEVVNAARDAVFDAAVLAAFPEAP